MAGDAPAPLVITQPLGEGLGRTQEVQDTGVLIERQQGIAQVARGRWPVPACRGLGEMRQGRQRLLKVRHGLAVRRARHGLGPGLPAVGQGLVPHSSPRRA